VGRVDPQGRVVDARVRDAEGVEARELRDVDVGDHGAELVHGVPWLVEPRRGEEVVRGHGHRSGPCMGTHSHALHARDEKK
jgi:hypothetical protein